jgi:multiple sugar transport system permease protein
MHGSRSARLFRHVAAWLVVILFALPIYYWITVAFKPERDIFALPPKFFVFDWNMQSFEKVFGISFGFEQTSAIGPGGGNFYMLPNLWASVVIAALSTLLTVAIATLASYALSRMRVKGQHHFVFFVLSTRMMPPVAIAIPMFFIYMEVGLLDTYAGIILVHALMNIPLAVLLMKSFFDDIPTEIDEAALIDGASRPHIFRRIIVPMAMGGIAATAVLCFIFSWTEFLFVLTLTQTSFKTVPVAASTFVTSTGTAWGNMAALGVAAMIPAFIFILLVQRNLVRGLTLGAVKQ